MPSAADRYRYTVGVPNMYHIVGREGAVALRSQSWQEGWDARQQDIAARAAEKDRKLAERWANAKRDFDSVGRTPFNGVKAIAKRHQVCAKRLKRYADRSNGNDSDSSALVADSGPESSSDGDSDATM